MGSEINKKTEVPKMKLIKGQELWFMGEKAIYNYKSVKYQTYYFRIVGRSYFTNLGSEKDLMEIMSNQEFHKNYKETMTADEMIGSGMF
jgi:hypothetical protein